MQLSQSTSMRMEQRQLLTPRMIQSMEILQLPLLALEERIEQELQNNPVLELREGDGQADDFERLAKISEYFENDDYSSLTGSNFRVSSYDGERDKKLDAMNNTAARGITLSEHLLGQWAFVECTPEVRKAGEVLINNIDADGYIRTPLEQMQIQKDS